MKRIERHACFSGHQEVWQHRSETLGCEMSFGVFLPAQAAKQPCGVLYFLSGLTCTPQNFITKSGMQRFAAEHGIIVVVPDTSPRGEGVADDELYSLGQGAGFYVNATRQPWAQHFQMYDYVVHELPALVDRHFPVTQARAVSGHSMGGHGALVVALKNPGVYRSVSALSPIVAPTRTPWGEHAFTAYLGDDRDCWRAWDACELVRDAQERLPLLIDQGDADEFLEEQLQPELLRAACEGADHPLTLRMQAGFDHSFYFVSTFIGDHIAHHAESLCDS